MAQTQESKTKSVTVMKKKIIAWILIVTPITTLVTLGAIYVSPWVLVIVGSIFIASLMIVAGSLLLTK